MPNVHIWSDLLPAKQSVVFGYNSGQLLFSEPFKKNSNYAKQMKKINESTPINEMRILVEPRKDCDTLV